VVKKTQKEAISLRFKTLKGVAPGRKEFGELILTPMIEGLKHHLFLELQSI
jgi:hypothetical protein